MYVLKGLIKKSTQQKYLMSVSQAEMPNAATLYLFHSLNIFLTD